LRLKRFLRLRLKENFDRFNFDIHKEKEMVDFRRCITALGLASLFAGLAAAQGSGVQTPLTCSTNVTAVAQLRVEGFTENTGDITITCTGGANSVVGAAIPTANITVFLNTQVTSRLLNGSGTASEALLLIDEPGSLSLPAAVGPGQPFGPQAPQRVCPNPATGCPEVVGSVVTVGGPLPGTTIAVPTVAGDTGAGTTAATVNGFNVFQGEVSGSSVTWFGVPILAPGTTGITRTFRITNIRVNASLLGVNTPVIASLSVSNTTALPITNATPTVGFVQKGLTTAASSSVSLQQCNTQTRTFISTVSFAEGFGTAFKTRVVPPSGAGATVNSSQGTGAGQNVPGSIFNSESNFIPGGTSAVATAGLADWGTRLKATFNNVPTGVRLFVSINNVLNGNAGLAPAPTVVGGNDTNTSFAEAVTSETAAENSGAGSFPASPAFSSSAKASNGAAIPITELTVTGGTATAVWEVVNTNPSALETFYFAVYTTFTAGVSTNTPPPGSATVNLSFAPSPPTAFLASAGPVASGSLIPRFIQDPNAAKAIFGVNVCRSILLYPFITNQAGFDTGIAIANTSTDPFQTSPQSGTCTLNWFSGAASPAPTTTGTVASGAVFTALASTTVTGFQGYMIAVCNFQYAHGFAFISDLGARNLAMGYLALVIPDPATAGNSRNADPLSTAVGGSGENIAH
jgi:hypothetical protein